MDFSTEIPERYRVVYDKVTDCFKILDTHHPQVMNLGFDADIPDNSPAMKIVTNSEVNALLGTLNKIGWIERIFGVGGKNTSVKHDVVEKKDIKQVAIENIKDIAVEAIKMPDSELGDSVKEAISAIREVAGK